MSKPKPRFTSVTRRGLKTLASLVSAQGWDKAPTTVELSARETRELEQALSWIEATCCENETSADPEPSPSASADSSSPS